MKQILLFFAVAFLLVSCSMKAPDELFIRGETFDTVAVTIEEDNTKDNFYCIDAYHLQRSIHPRVYSGVVCVRHFYDKLVTKYNPYTDELYEEKERQIDYEYAIVTLEFQSRRYRKFKVCVSPYYSKPYKW